MGNNNILISWKYYIIGRMVTHEENKDNFSGW
jgi:hypothetical protein